MKGYRQALTIPDSLKTLPSTTRFHHNLSIRLSHISNHLSILMFYHPIEQGQRFTFFGLQADTVDQFLARSR